MPTLPWPQAFVSFLIYGLPNGLPGLPKPRFMVYPGTVDSYVILLASHAGGLRDEPKGCRHQRQLTVLNFIFSLQSTTSKRENQSPHLQAFQTHYGRSRQDHKNQPGTLQINKSTTIFHGLHIHTCMDADMDTCRHTYFICYVGL